jgi:hypothetical protein
LAKAHDEVHDPKKDPPKRQAFHLDSLGMGENAFEELECRVMSEAFLRGDQFVFVDGIFDGNSHWL